MKSALLKNDNNTFRVKTIFSELNIGVTGRSANTIDYTKKFSIIRKNEKNLLNNILQIKKNSLIFLNQVHEDNILLIDTPLGKNKETVGDADGVITSSRETCLVIRTADCVPIFFYDSKNKILGAAHSGWRSTELSISKKLVNKMCKIYNSSCDDIYVYILPSIGPESYEINEDVAKYFKDDIVVKNNKIFLSLWQNIENSLANEGIPEKNITNCNICNLQNKDKFFSYRFGDSGRNLNFGLMK